MAFEEQLQEIKRQLRLSMNGAVAQSMREQGLVYQQNFGVELPRLKMIAAGLEKSHPLAQALWKEEVRECKILAGLLQPVESFLPEIADIWAESIRQMEIAEMSCMHLFQHLPYAPSKSFQWMASEQAFVQVCGFLTIARLLPVKEAMGERVSNEFIDQAIAAALSDSLPLRSASLLAIRRFMQQRTENVFTLCRSTESLRNAGNEREQALYNLVKEEAEVS
jgi:3-methyladenine DNA glycosylase AlkD